MSLGVNEETAYEDACRIEHDLSDETFQALKNMENGAQLLFGTDTKSTL